MRSLPYLILAYVILGVQLGVKDYISYAGAAPNFVLLAVVFVAVHAQRDAALLGAFSIGLLQDVLTTQPLGIYALSYGLVGLLIVGAQHVVYREHPAAHFALALLGGLITATLLALQSWLRPAAPALAQEAGNLPAMTAAAGPPFISAVYTALLAPGVLWVLNQFRRFFGFHPRQRARAW